MTAGVATEKQRAIAAELRQNPAKSDSDLARSTGCSRSLVRRMRDRLGLADVPREAPAPRSEAPLATPDAPEAPAPRREGRPWPKALDPIFDPGGAAQLLENDIKDLLEWEARFDRHLAALEVSTRGRHAARNRMQLHHQMLALARRILLELVPVGPCPFCGIEHKCSGCERCTRGGWAAADSVDAFATMEEKQKHSRWWRRPGVEVPG